MSPTLHDAPRDVLWTARRVRALWIGWWVLLFAAMHTPKPVGISQPFRFFDKLVHLGGYAVLAGLCFWSAKASGVRTDGRWYAKWLVVLAGYAALDEMLQPLVNRYCDYRDWLTDVCGVLLGFAAARLMLRRLNAQPGNGGV